MPAPLYRTYHYHANAHVLSAQFKRPVEHLIEVQAATSLPTIGGHGSSRVENFRFQEFVSFRKGYSHVSGSPQEVEGKTHFTTLVTAVAEGLNILDVVTADRIVARFASSHTFDNQEPNFTLVGSKFDNLQIAGCKTEVDLDIELFEKIPTFEAARKEFKNNRDFRKMAEDPFETGEKLPEQPVHGVLLCSIVDQKKMKTTCPGVERKGHCFMIPKFGKLFLGEILLQHCRRTLTMIRLELGSPVSGTGTVVQADSNGRTYPPTG